MANGEGNGAVNGMGNGEEMAEQFFNDGDNKTPGKNRAELEKKTVKQLAEIAKPFSALTLATLQKKSKKFLIAIIFSQGKNEEEKKAAPRATRTESESQQLVNLSLHVLNEMKERRDKEPLNPIVTEVFKAQAVAKTDNAIENDAELMQKTSNVVLFGSAALVVIDSVIGFKNIPTLFSKLSSKMKKKNATSTK